MLDNFTSVSGNPPEVMAAAEIDQGLFAVGKLYRTIFRRFNAWMTVLPSADDGVLLPPSQQRASELPNSLIQAAVSGKAAISAKSQDPSTKRIADAHRAPDENAEIPLRFSHFRDCLAASREESAVEVGEQIRALRNALGWSRSDAAQQLGCELEQVIVMENGCGNPAEASAMLVQFQRFTGR